MSEITLDLQLTHQAFALELLKQEFAEIVGSDRPVIDKTVECSRLLGEASKAFEPFIKTAKQHAKAQLVPNAKDEVIIGKTRIVHRSQAGNGLDKEGWAKAVEASTKLAKIEMAAFDAKAALAKAQEPFRKLSTWIEIEAAK